jgi:hypothetical protein
MAGRRPCALEKNLGPGKLSVLLPEAGGRDRDPLPLGQRGRSGCDACAIPFPVTRRPNVSLSGTAESVLFHNGTWGGVCRCPVRLSSIARTNRCPPVR